jgi:hypothetical protein
MLPSEHVGQASALRAPGIQVTQDRDTGRRQFQSAPTPQSKQVDVLVIESSGGKTLCFEPSERPAVASGRAASCCTNPTSTTARATCSRRERRLPRSRDHNRVPHRSRPGRRCGRRRPFVLSPSIPRELIASLQSCPETLEKLSKLTAGERDVFTGAVPRTQVRVQTS